jgi:hypothetical protein
MQALAALPQHLHDLGTRLRQALRRGDTAEALAVAAQLELGQYKPPTTTEDLRCTGCGAQDWTWWYNDACCRPIQKVDPEQKRFDADLSEWEHLDSPAWEARDRLTCNRCHQEHEMPDGWGHSDPEVAARESRNSGRVGVHSRSDSAAYDRFCAFQEAPEYNRLLTAVRALENQDTPHEGGCGCPGWGLFDTGSWMEVERCDECERFEDDESAARYVIQELRSQGVLEALAPGLPVCTDLDCDLCWLHILLPWYDPEAT